MRLAIGPICRIPALNRRSFSQLLAFVLPLVPFSMASAIPLPPLQPSPTGGAGNSSTDFIEAYGSESSAAIRARKLGCQGVRREGSLYVPCASGAEYQARMQPRTV
jgi:ribosomal protein L36